MREEFVQLDRMIPMIREQVSSGNPVIFTPRGKSMLPTIRGGFDQVVLEALPHRLKKYDMPLYRRDDGQYVLHRIIAVDAVRGEYTMMGDNQFYPELHVRHDQLIAVVTAVIKNGEKTPVDRLKFRLYSRFWHFTRPVRHFIRRSIGFLKRKLGK